MRTIIIYTSEKKMMQKLASAIGADLRYMYVQSPKTPTDVSGYDRVIIYNGTRLGKKISGNFERFCENNPHLVTTADLIVGAPFSKDVTEQSFTEFAGRLDDEITYLGREFHLSGDPVYIATGKDEMEYSNYLAERRNGNVVCLNEITLTDERRLFVMPFHSRTAGNSASGKMLTLGIICMMMLPLLRMGTLGSVRFMLTVMLIAPIAIFFWILAMDLLNGENVLILNRLKNRDGSQRRIRYQKFYGCVCVCVVALCVAIVAISFFVS